MAKRIGITKLNARTIDILNTIRQNASAEYQSLVPEVQVEQDIVKVGDVLFGYPAMANQFLSALMNRIALVKVKSATFNNAYTELKKGYLEFGETVEEVFVNIAKAREFSAEKAEKREFKRSIPDVRSAFHTMNWRVQYPVTIQNEDLRMAFTSFGGVEDLIARIVDSIYTASEYDEYLLFKYLLIKGVAKGKMFPVAIDDTDIKDSAKKFRGISNQLEFMNTKYNASGVHTTTKKEEQYIFMDAQFNADYDVDVLASAFNMDKTTYVGHLKLIDSFDTFDNDRFDVIRSASDMIEEVTADELALMKGVKAILVDKEWFQIYDNANTMTEQYVASGMYWNYFYNVWKTVSSSPFSNAVVFASDVTNTKEEGITFKVEDLIKSESAIIVTIGGAVGASGKAYDDCRFIQTATLTEAGVAVHKYGAFIVPAELEETGIPAESMEVEINGFTYKNAEAVTDVDIGNEIVFE